MKNLVLALSCALCTYTVSAQDADAIQIVTGGTFAKPKITPRLEKLALAQITVSYKLNTTHTTIGKGGGKMAGAKVTAYLETSDGNLTESDFQEVTDYFYSYFQKKLKANGIDTVAWGTVTSSDLYQAADGKVQDNEEEKGKGNVWVTYNANKGNTIYGGNIAFTFGKAKKASRFCDDIDAPAGFFYLTVDFADIMVDVDIKSKEPSYPSGFYPYTKTTTFKYNAATKPNMKIIPTNPGFTLLWNAKSQSETVSLQKEISSGVTYHTSVTQDKSRLKNNLFAFAKEMDPVVIETTRDKYKLAAKKALEKYADAYIAKAIELKRD